MSKIYIPLPKKEDLNLFLNENKEFKTKFYKVGDGIAISLKED